MAEYLTPDGCQEGIASWTEQSDMCCMPPQCVDPCASACGMLWALPSGPMWDHQKIEAQEWIESRRGDPTFNLCAPLIPCVSDECPTLARFALFLSQYVNQTIDNTLWAAHREANPFTAVSTLDQWKERLGYTDCLGQCPPYSDFEIPFNPDRIPGDLQCALDSGIVKAITRMRMGGIENLCWMNWLIEPLGAEIRPYHWCDPELDGDPVIEDCCDMQFQVCPISDTLDACGHAHCYEQSGELKVRATIRQDGVTYYPGVYVATCLLRSFLPDCPSAIFVCPEPSAITVEGGIVTKFVRGGVNYTQVMFRQNGSISLNRDIEGVSYALVAGGGSGASTGSATGGGGGGQAIQTLNISFPPGEYRVVIGQGGEGQAGNGPGNKGGNTELYIDGALAFTMEGGGGGGGSGSGMSGGDGGNGGGGSTNSSVSNSGGVGVQFNGGDAFGSASATERAGGGGGGAVSAGENASASTGGNGGIGLDIEFTETPLAVSGGGGGAPNTDTGTSGNASHGGTSGVTGSAAGSEDATDGGGSGGADSSLRSGNGGDGLAVFVFPTDNASEP